jgi:hypothetical protein
LLTTTNETPDIGRPLLIITHINLSSLSIVPKRVVTKQMPLE